MEYFSSDWHLCHKNILKYDNRPFNTIEEHNQSLLDNYNSIIKEEDSFYFLGDFCMGHYQDAEKILKQMNGIKYFISGNHDPSPTIKMYKKYGTYLGNLEEVVIQGQNIVLCHYSMRVWHGNHKGYWHLFGHSHGSLDNLPNGKSFDVAINKWNYKPLSFNQIKDEMSKRELVALDHHTQQTSHR